MTKKPLGQQELAELRRQAEELLRQRGGSREVRPPAEEVDRVVHDLRVHQVELEMQNDELRRVQASLLAERGRYFDLFELAPVGYLTLSSDGAILEANLTAAALLGEPRASIQGKQLTSFILGDDQDTYYLHRRSIGSDATPRECEVRLARVDGGRRWVSLSTVVAREPDGLPVSRVVINDISDRRRAEDDLELGRERFAEAEKLEAVGRLAGRAAHSLNNILQALSSLSALLGVSSAAPESMKLIEQIDLQIARGAVLAQQLLIFSPDGTATRATIDLRRLVESATPAIRALLPAAVKLDVAVSDAPAPFLVDGDSGQLEEIVTNLAIGARDALPSGGTLWIRLSARTGVAVLEVESRGHGIAEESRRHYFEPFTPSKNAKGAAVRGLAAAFGIVQKLGGRIEVDGAVGKGSLLRVVLPAVTPLSVIARHESAELIRGHGEHVLVVEDDDAAREGVADLLRLLGYVVSSVPSGEGALALPAVPVADLLLCDVLLPGISGPALAERMRTRWPGIRVILMSGYTSDVVVGRSATGEATRFLQKPFEMARLTRELRAELEGRGDR